MSQREFSFVQFRFRFVSRSAVGLGHTIGKTAPIPSSLSLHMAITLKTLVNPFARRLDFKLGVEENFRRMLTLANFHLVWLGQNSLS